nr:hypothetical protein [Priestia megaterium]
MHKVVTQTVHLSIGYSKQTVGGFSRQKKMDSICGKNN